MRNWYDEVLFELVIEDPIRAKIFLTRLLERGVTLSKPVESLTEEEVRSVLWLIINELELAEIKH